MNLSLCLISRGSNHHLFSVPKPLSHLEGFESPPSSSVPLPLEAAKRVGEELIKASIDLKINEISSYDRNGNARGERMQAFEIAIKQHGFLP
ncbi:hypothetical protein F2Q70_00041712 [Brassica cretica]|uniref:Uncharacterized protein n=1 Tax=Brassica cretica TaxID=69181 RepID=A0A8S9KD47_BRACR|nr:hypothetical protein F2Q70_00041712 [Brassica cretica]